MRGGPERDPFRPRACWCRVLADVIDASHSRARVARTQRSGYVFIYTPRRARVERGGGVRPDIFLSVYSPRSIDRERDAPGAAFLGGHPDFVSRPGDLKKHQAKFP